ncbi:Panacea domain-containing protein [Maioricimonas sp. JC845]|uniref:Panacea domain-containing protein n=1 Tax=Maioricimonas sp. JC845 TaxID=3232138 RepID=UPI00345975A7
MASLRDIMTYLCEHYPYKDDLSRAKLTKLVYLADWKSAIDHGRQMSNIEWYFDNYGPFVWKVWDTASENPETFEIEKSENMFGNPKHVIRLTGRAAPASLEPEEQAVLDHVISTTKDLGWNDFIKLVYSTYPVVSSERYSQLDLVKKAREYAAPPPL